MMDVKEQNVVPRTFMHHLSARNTRYYFEALLKMSQTEVAGFRGDFLDMQYCFGGEAIEPFKKRLLKTFSCLIA